MFFQAMGSMRSETKHSPQTDCYNLLPTLGLKKECHETSTKNIVCTLLRVLVIFIDTKPGCPCSLFSSVLPGGPEVPRGPGDPRYTEVCVDTTVIRTRQRSHLVCIEL